MPNQLPEYDNPPVVETVMGAQFEALKGFNAAHAGRFWNERLDDSWSRADELGALLEQFEWFDDRKWGKAGISFGPAGPNRVHIVRNDDERVMQIQPTRFLYNWRKREAGYPSYGELLPEFKEKLSAFVDFANKAGFGDVTMNQWEITYVNHIHRGTLWETPAEWSRVLPWFVAPASDEDYLTQERFVGQWVHVIGEEQGRLHVDLKHGRVGSPAGTESMILQLTARGPLTKDTDLFDGLAIGHETIVKAFSAMTSPDAHALWKRTK